MAKTRIFLGILGAALFLTVVSSVRADSFHSDMFFEKAIYAERHDLTISDGLSAEISYLYAGHFENNNGKHLGFSMASVNRGPRLGIVKPQSPDSVSQNPEPTAMVLLGTGLAAVAGIARRRSRRHRRR